MSKKDSPDAARRRRMASSRSISGSGGEASFGCADMVEWWLERKRRHSTVVDKSRRPIPTWHALSLKRRALTTVTYRRTAWETDGWRVTLDREVRTHNRELGLVVLEVKGTAPAWLTRRLGPPDHHFSKSSWALGREGG